MIFRKTLFFQALTLKSVSVTALRVNIFVKRKKAFISEDETQFSSIHVMCFESIKFKPSILLIERVICTHTRIVCDIRGDC